ncbi:MAG: ribbon-helix-helix domain-containing protein [Candidatus Gottesmanbacteria bacterium]|nr:ribbon-helix-helix domain-containing protein [Candidatus Gottesmanbacteria bacterium]
MQTQSFNIVLPKELVQKIDAVAKREYRNRSELIREAAWIYLQRRMEWDELFSYGKAMGKKMGITNEEDVNKIVWNYRHGKKQ